MLRTCTARRTAPTYVESDASYSPVDRSGAEGGGASNLLAHPSTHAIRVTTTYNYYNHGSANGSTTHT
ncbi:hypothetical protein B0H34DRAFT_734483, partial [Crassisporium funariophilum]